jgi:hypothetical protein
VAAGGADDYAEQRAEGQLCGLTRPWLQRFPRPRVDADLAPAVVLSVADQNRPPAPIQIGLGQRQRLMDPQPGATEHHDQAGEPVTVASLLSLAHHRDDLIDARRVSGVPLTLVPRRLARAEPGHRRRPASAPSHIDER